MGESNPREVGGLAMMQAYVNEVVHLRKREERREMPEAPELPGPLTGWTRL